MPLVVGLSHRMHSSGAPSTSLVACLLGIAAFQQSLHTGKLRYQRMWDTVAWIVQKWNRESCKGDTLGGKARL